MSLTWPGVMQNRKGRPSLSASTWILVVSPPSGTPQRLILGPPFPVAACWWARTMVLSSIRYWLSRSAVSAVNTASHTPAWHQRLKRRCTVVHLP